MGVTHTFTSGISDDPADASAGKVLPSHWNAAHTVTGLGVLDGNNAWTGKQTYSIGHTAWEQEITDAAIGSINCRFYDTDFSGVNDPVMFLGHNAAGAPSGATRFFMGLEGHYNDVANSHVWAEFYLHRYDSDGTTNHRPFSVSAYDGFSTVSYAADNIDFNSRTNTAAYDFGYIRTGTNPYLYVTSNALIIHAGNNINFFQQRNAANTAYIDLIFVNSSNSVCVGNGPAGNFTTQVYDLWSKTTVKVAADYNPPAGGTTGLGLIFAYPPDKLGIFFGSGAPSLSAAKGSMYLRTDGSGTTDRCYINTNGSTTWTAIVTVA